jgi:hypothetical protein
MLLSTRPPWAPTMCKFWPFSIFCADRYFNIPW